MCPLAVFCFAIAAGGGCNYPVAVQPWPASDVPRPLAPSPSSVGLLVDAARVPDEIAVHDSLDNPLCAFTRYPLAARASVTAAVVDTLNVAVRDVRLLDTAMHRWNVQSEGLDAALVVRVEAFAVNLYPTRKLVGAEFRAEAELTLSVVAITGDGREILETVSATATQTAVDRWGLGGCSRGVPPATRAARLAIRNTMAELMAWTTETLTPARSLQEGAAP